MRGRRWENDELSPRHGRRRDAFRRRRQPYFDSAAIALAKSTKSEQMNEQESGEKDEGGGGRRGRCSWDSERGKTPSCEYSERISLQFGTVSRRQCSPYQGRILIGPAFPRYDSGRLILAIPSPEVRSYFSTSPHLQSFVHWSLAVVNGAKSITVEGDFVGCSSVLIEVP